MSESQHYVSQESLNFTGLKYDSTAREKNHLANRLSKDDFRELECSRLFRGAL